MVAGCSLDGKKQIVPDPSSTFLRSLAWSSRVFDSGLRAPTIHTFDAQLKIAGTGTRAGDTVFQTIGLFICCR